MFSVTSSSYVKRNIRITRPQFSTSYLRADLDGTIFAYDCRMRPAHIMSATRIVPPESHVQHLHDSCTHSQNVRMTSCLRFLLDASRARYKSRTRHEQS